jgi:hypothetical protein
LFIFGMMWWKLLFWWGWVESWNQPDCCMLIHGILVSIWLIGVLIILYHVLLCTTSTTQNLNPKTTTQSQSQNLLDFAFPPNPNPPNPPDAPPRSSLATRTRPSPPPVRWTSRCASRCVTRWARFIDTCGSWRRRLRRRTCQVGGLVGVEVGGGQLVVELCFFGQAYRFVNR